MEHTLSIIIPVYNEEGNLNNLNEKIKTVLNKMNNQYEIIYVDDCSTDNSFHILKSFKSDNIKIIKFAKNFGQTAAMQAGINHSTGDIIITLDADLQNNPENIPDLIKKYDEGYNLVSGWRKKRQDNILRTIPSKIANFLITKITNTNLHDSGCTLKAYNGEILRKINLFPDHHRFIPAIFAEYSNKITEIEVEHNPRISGKSKYNILRVYRVILDLIAIAYWKKYKHKPIYFWGGLSVISILLSLLALIFSVSNIIYSILFLIFFTNSILLFGIGLIFESLLRYNLEQNKAQIYSIETIL